MKIQLKVLTIYSSVPELKLGLINKIKIFKTYWSALACSKIYVLNQDCKMVLINFILKKKKNKK